MEERRRTYRYGNAQVAGGFSLVHTACRRNVRIVAANGHADMAISTDQVVGRVECSPT